MAPELRPGSGDPQRWSMSKVDVKSAVAHLSSDAAVKLTQLARRAIEAWEVVREGGGGSGGWRWR